jgi:hypothetical protein
MFPQSFFNNVKARTRCAVCTDILHTMGDCTYIHTYLHAYILGPNLKEL